MENKIIIGQKMTKKGVWINFLLLSLFGFIAARGCYYLVANYFSNSFFVKMISAFIAYLGIMLVLIPIIGSSETLEFSKDKVCHYQVEGYLRQVQEILRILTNTKEVPDLEVRMEHIDKVSLTYISTLSIRGLKMYKFRMMFLLKDGTYIYYFPSTVGQMEKGDYEKVFLLLEENGIEIIDKYHIRPALSMDTQGYFDYIDQIDKKRRLS